MEVNFNAVRKRLLADYEKLVEILNSGIEMENIYLPLEDVDQVMANLRASIATVLLTSEEGNENFSNVLGDKVLAEFNAIEEEWNDEDEIVVL
jgi:hypothetical protein